jgi:hypothetical protein
MAGGFRVQSSGKWVYFCHGLLSGSHTKLRGARGFLSFVFDLCALARAKSFVGMVIGFVRDSGVPVFICKSRRFAPGAAQQELENERFRLVAWCKTRRLLSFGSDILRAWCVVGGELSGVSSQSSVA